MFKKMLIAVFVLALTVSAFAIDPWDALSPGLSWSEIDLNFDITGGSFGHSTLFGIGIVDSMLALWLTTGIDNGGLMGGGFGLMLTPVNSDLVSLDILANYDYAPDSHCGTGSFELNLNTAVSPWLDGYISDVSDDDVMYGGFGLGVLYGVYDGGEVLFKAFSDVATGSAPSFGVALGFNFMLGDSPEMITEISYDITGESIGGYVGLGF